MGIKYIVHFAQSHPEFRLPELQSVSELFGFSVSRPDDVFDPWDPLRPFWVISLEKEEHAVSLSQRCILIK